MLIDPKKLEQTIIETILRDLFNSDEDYRSDAESVAKTVIESMEKQSQCLDANTTN
jgi:hypothetical protein